jgi:hypothetical protein
MRGRWKRCLSQMATEGGNFLTAAAKERQGRSSNTARGSAVDLSGAHERTIQEHNFPGLEAV